MHGATMKSTLLYLVLKDLPERLDWGLALHVSSTYVCDLGSPPLQTITNPTLPMRNGLSYKILTAYWCTVLRQTGHRGRGDFNHVDVDAFDSSLSLSFRPKLYPPLKGPDPDYPHVALQDRQYLECCVEPCM
jgi:hypothetical protein